MGRSQYLRWRGDRRKISIPLWAGPVLERLAFAFYEGKDSIYASISDSELQAVIWRARSEFEREYGCAPSVEEVYQLLIYDDGLLIPQHGPGESRYRFFHRTFQEYSAARHLKKLLETPGEAAEKTWKLIEQKMWDPWWEDILVFLAAMADDAHRTNLIGLLLKNGDEKIDVPRRMLFLGARCLGESAKTATTEPLASQAIEELKPLLQTGFRKLAAETLGQLGRQHSGAVSILSRAIKAPPVSFPMLPELLRALSQCRATDEVLCELAIVLLDRSSDERVIATAALALGRLRTATPQVVSALITVLQNKTLGEGARRSAAEALGQVGEHSDEVISALAAVLVDEATAMRDVSIKAMDALGRLGVATPEVVSRLP